MAEWLRLQDLRAGYGQAEVLHGISLTLVPGKTLALLGRNGAGKSTLINTLAGATRQHGGGIWLGGQALHSLPSHQRAAAGIGWVPQGRHIFKSLTVAENLSAVARPGPWTPQRVYQLFPRLAERQRNLGTQLSGGEQQMLALGRALVLNPRLLLLDEPLEGLAPLLVQELLQAMAQLTREQGMGLLIAEQALAPVLDLAEQALVLERGHVAYSGPARTLQAQPALCERLLGVGGGHGLAPTPAAG